MLHKNYLVFIISLRYNKSKNIDNLIGQHIYYLLIIRKVLTWLNRSKLWEILNNKGISLHLVNLIKTLYYTGSNVRINVDNRINKRWFRQRKKFAKGVQSPRYFFYLYLDDITKTWKMCAYCVFKVN